MAVHYTYVLLSQEDNRLYPGCTHNLEKRVLGQNNARVSSTAHRVPLELIYFEVVWGTVTMHSAVSGSSRPAKASAF